MPISFHKMHGAGNDFVLLDLRGQPLQVDSAFAQAIADRKTGVGCDQLLVLHRGQAEGALLRFDVWNADGSRAEQCGNGVRCIALYLHSTGEAGEGSVLLDGPVNQVQAEYLGKGQVRVNMGAPVFTPEQVPVDLLPEDGWYELETASRLLQFGAVSMGNPHVVIPVDDADKADVGNLGPEISRHQAFPEGCNVGFAQRLDPATVRLRVYERGSGETSACGSGACAAIAVMKRQFEMSSEVCVIQPGGELIIAWNGEDEPVHMTGPAVHVFEGILQ